MIRAHALPAWQSYGLALAASLLTAAVAVAASHWLGPSAWLLFAVPAALSGWVGGFGPGALAAMVGILTLSYFLNAPIGNLAQVGLAETAPVATAALVLAFLASLAARARQAAAQARALSARSAALAQAAWAMNHASSPQNVLETLARELSALPGGVVVQRLSDDGEALHTAAVHHPDPESLAALREAFAAPQRTAESLGRGALAAGQPALLPSVSAEQLRAGLKPRFWPNLERFAGSSVLLAPLASQGAVLGLASLLRPALAGPFDEAEQAHVTALAERAAAALRMAQQYENESQRRHAAEARAASARRLQGLAAALCAARTPDQVTAVQVELALETGNADADEAGGRAALARQAEAALDRMRAAAAEAADRAAAELAATRLAELEAATAALNQATTLEAVLDRALRGGLALARAETGAVSLLLEAAGPLELARSHGYPELALHSLRSVRLDQPAAEAQAARQGEAIWLASREACVTHFPAFAQAYASLRGEALAVLPLTVDGEAAGTLALGLVDAREWTGAEQAALLAYAARCGQAVRRAQHLARERQNREAAERARARAVHLAEISDTLTQTLSLPDTLHNIARLALRDLADFCLAFALGHEGHPLGWAHAHRDPEREALLGGGIRLLLTMPSQQRTAIVDRLRAGRMLHVPELSDSMLASVPAENGLRQLVQELQPRALLLAPLMHDGQSQGVLVLCALEAGRFGSDEKALAQALAQRAARAVAHARRHAVAQSLNAELEERVNERTEELQASIAKLEDENTQRERTQAQLELSREQLRSLSARLQAAREEERAHLAREVHDELGQQLASIKMDIAWLRKKLREQQEPLLRKAKAMADLIDTSVQSVRKITQELRPGILDDFGLQAAVEWQLQEFQKRHNIETQLLSGVDDDQLAPEAATAVFRVFQETLSNVARHANATRVEVSLEKIDQQLVLQVEDNGRGITERELYGAGSLGLLGMRERIHLLAGDIDIRGEPGTGTLVRVRIPLAGARPGGTGNGNALPAPGTHSN